MAIYLSRRRVAREPREGTREAIKKHPTQSGVMCVLCVMTNPQLVLVLCPWRVDARNLKHLFTLITAPSLLMRCHRSAAGSHICVSFHPVPLTSTPYPFGPMDFNPRGDLSCSPRSCTPRNPANRFSNRNRPLYLVHFTVCTTQSPIAVALTQRRGRDKGATFAPFKKQTQLPCGGAYLSGFR